MTNYDVFNGDADGICALLQLRLAEPCEAQLITGVKRDISLLEQVAAKSGDQICVLDISMDKNQTALARVLKQGASVFYADHHYPGDIPEHERLTTLINTEAEICTSILMDEHIGGQFRNWAIVGAFGDNLSNSAEKLANAAAGPRCITPATGHTRLNELRQLGIYINYNGYGATLDDLHFKPTELFNILKQYADPLNFIDKDKGTFSKLETGYQQDMGAAGRTKPYSEQANTAVYMLPNEAWARRVSGVFGNDLANQFPDRGHAIVTEKADGNYLVSIRAPINNRVGADEICRQFPSGGGRKAAAGINLLPTEQLDKFISVFSEYYLSDKNDSD